MDKNLRKTNKSAAIEKAIKRIDEAALTAHKAKGTAEYDELAEEFYKVLSAEYANYLYANSKCNNSFCCLKEGEFDPYEEERQKLSDMFCCVLLKKEFPMDLLRNFDPEENYKGSFFSFFNAIAKKQYEKSKGIKNSEENSGGITHIYSDKKRDRQLLKKFNKFFESANGCDICEINNKAIKAFCEDKENDEKKLIRALIAKKSSSVKVVPVDGEEYDDSSDFILSEFDSYSVEQHRIQETENDAIKLENVLLKINEIFSGNKLNETEKKIYSAWVTSVFIDGMIKEVKDANKIDSLDTTLEKYFDYINLNAKKEIYASGKYFCIYPEVFDYVSEHKKRVLLKDVAEFFGCTSPYIKKVVDKVNDMLDKEQFLI